MRQLASSLAAAALACFASSSFAAGWQAAAAPDSFGLNVHFIEPKPGEMEQIAGSGAKWLRNDLNWKATEKAAGVYDFSNYDKYIAAIEAAKMRTILILDYSNALYDGDRSPYTEAGRAAFAKWAVAAVTHFKGRGILWEIWNEPNSPTFWKPKPNADDYAKLALTVGKALRAAAPDEAVVGPAVSTMDFGFLETCFKAGVLEYFSAVTCHPYRQGPPETVLVDYQKLHLLIARYAPPGKTIPILCSEWGYSDIWPKYDVDRQAKVLARQWLTNLSAGINVNIWYDWKDDFDSPKNPEAHFGMTRFVKGGLPPFPPKPAYAAAATFSTQLAGLPFSKRLMVDSPDDYVLLFGQGSDLRLVAWTTAAAHIITLPASDGAFDCVGYLGGGAPAINASAGTLTLKLDDSPVYLRPQQSNDLLNVAAAWQRLPDRILDRAPIDLKVKNTISNPTAAPITVSGPDGKWQTVAAGQSAKVELPVKILRTAQRQTVALSIAVNGATFTQQTTAGALNALDLKIVPAGTSSLSLRVLNPGGEAFTGTVHVRATDGGLTADTPLELAAGENKRTIELKAANAIPSKADLAVRLTDSAGQTVADIKQGYDATLGDALNAGQWEIKPGGDPKIASAQSIALSDAPEPPPGNAGPVFRIDYHFDPGSKYLFLSPKHNDVRKIDGAPQTLGLWVYGNGAGNRPVLRFRDSTDQVFQPAANPIDFKGWRYLTFPLNEGSVFHFGGANDAVIHYPIQWDSIFMLDTTQRDKPSEGTIYIAAPTVVWDRD